MLRPLIEIDEELCNGCGQCITDCAEGALAIVNGKAKLISESYCDGLGACLNCPQGALALVIADAPAFDEKAALAAKAAREAQEAPLAPLQPMAAAQMQSTLRTWPLQLALMPPAAVFLKNASLILCAHCSGFALPGIQKDHLAGHVPLIACPKLENNAMLVEKLAAILAANDIRDLTVLRMEVPCCGGLTAIAQKALEQTQKNIEPAINVVQL